MRFALVALLASAGILSGQSLQIVTDTLPPATVGVAYSQQLAVNPGTCPNDGQSSSSIDSGALPPGLSVISASGVRQWAIQGTPTAAGPFTFALHLHWVRPKATPFQQDCVEDAVKTLTLTVSTGQAPTSLTVDRAQVSTTYRTAGFPPGPETVHLTSSGNAPVAFNLQSSTAGGNWLSVVSSSSLTPATLTLSFSIDGLAPGVYTGAVAISSTAGGQLTIPVTLTVITDSSIILVAKPASLAFTSLAGAAAPAPQTLNVTVAGASVLFRAEVSVSPAGTWLSVTPSGAATPAALSVAVNPKGLAPRNYNGTITLRVSGVPTPQTVPVTYSIPNSPVPSITLNGVVNGASLSAAIAPGSWVSIFGSNLSTTTREWRDADFVNGKLPTSLDGVSVTINGKAAAVSYVSPTQVNLLAPDDTTTGLVFAQVKTNAGTSDNAAVLEQTAAPAFFQFRAGSPGYAASTHASGAYVVGAALIQQGIPGTPAKPGETIVLYGTGFGATQPPFSATALVPAPLPLANPQDLRVRIGGIDAAIAFAGLISPGLYQFNVVVPPQLADGDQPVIAELRGLLTRADILLPVQH